LAVRWYFVVAMVLQRVLFCLFPNAISNGMPITKNGSKWHCSWSKSLQLVTHKLHTFFVVAPGRPTNASSERGTHSSPLASSSSLHLHSLAMLAASGPKRGPRWWPGRRSRPWPRCTSPRHGACPWPQAPPRALWTSRHCGPWAWWSMRTPHSARDADRDRDGGRRGDEPGECGGGLLLPLRA
jgi:hypothetical protein